MEVVRLLRNSNAGFITGIPAEQQKSQPERRKMARDGNGSGRRRGRPAKAEPDPGQFTSDEVRKFEAAYRLQKGRSQEASQVLSELFRDCIKKGAGRKALRFYAQLLQMPPARALDCFDRLRFYVETGCLSDQQDFVREQRLEAAAAAEREAATRPLV
jgi:hypothetical protein